MNNDVAGEDIFQRNRPADTGVLFCAEEGTIDGDDEDALVPLEAAGEADDLAGEDDSGVGELGK